MSPRERRVEVSGQPLFVVDSGKRAERPMVVLHGFPGVDHMSVRNTPGLENLEQVARVLYYDRRGTGHSSTEEPERGQVDTHATDLSELVDAMGLERPIVIAHDSGAAVALAFALAHPVALSGLVLCNPRLDLGAADRSKFEAQAADMLEDAAAGGLIGDPTNEPDVAFRRAMEQVFPLGFLHFGLVERTFMKQLTFHRQAYDLLWATEALDLSGRVSELRVPALIITGRYDPFTDLSRTREITQSSSHARFHLFHSSAHWPFLEEPQDFSDLILEWSEEVAAHIL